MSCKEIQDLLHPFLDGELSAADARAVEAHLDHCAICRQTREELEIIGRTLSVPLQMPAASSRLLLKRLERRRSGRWWAPLRAWMDSTLSYWRDLERITVWSRVAAAPLTLGCFVLLGAQFSRIPDLEWTYSIFPVAQLSPAETREHGLLMIHGLQQQREANSLMDTIWKIPYEDSLSLVAEVQPEGYARIEGVLEYPKNPDLLDALELALRNTHFDYTDDLPNSFLIHLQKVDVYEGQGL